MKYLFMKENRILSDLTEKGKKEHSFYTVLSVVFIVLGAFSFWEFIFELSNMIGSIVSGTPAQAIVELTRMLPLMLTSFTYVFLEMALHNAYRAQNEDKRAKLWQGNGVAAIVAGAIIAGYVICGLVIGLYGEIVEKYVSPLFPLDICIGGVLFCVYGYFSIVYAGKIRRYHTELPFYDDEKRNGRRRRPLHFFYVLSYLLSICGLAGFTYGLFTVDFTHGNIFFNIMLLLNYLAAFMMLVVYRYVYVELKPGYRNKADIGLSTFFLILNVVLLAVYFISVQLENEAPNLNAFSILPIDFTASFNAFFVLYGLNNVLAPLTALIHGLKTKKRH